MRRKAKQRHGSASLNSTLHGGATGRQASYVLSERTQRMRLGRPAREDTKTRIVPKCDRCKAELETTAKKWCPRCAAEALRTLDTKNRRIVFGHGGCESCGKYGTYTSGSVKDQFRCSHCGHELFTY